MARRRRRDWHPKEADSDTTLSIPGVAFQDNLRQRDQRGEFRKPYSRANFSGKGPSEVFFTKSEKGVVRGMHLSHVRTLSSKLVTLVHGQIFDVLIDLRKGPHFGSINTIIMTDESPTLVIPSGVAHGFQSLSSECIVLYCTQHTHAAAYEGGVNPLSLDIDWPHPVSAISDRDKNLPSIQMYERHYFG